MTAWYGNLWRFFRGKNVNLFKVYQGPKIQSLARFYQNFEDEFNSANFQP